ncbi:MAG: hypothetical protein Q9159_007494 [Coniocarpon cinnabarinum]
MSTKLPSSTQTLLKHYARLIRQWPTDILRPISFQNSMRQRLQSRFLAPTAAASPSDTVSSPTSSQSSTSTSTSTSQSPPSQSDSGTSTARAKAQQTASNLQGTGKPNDTTTAPMREKLERIARMTPAEKDKEEMEQVNALYSLLENRYEKTYACSERLMRPQFREGYYEELAREMEEAPRRSWWMRKWLRWRGIVRLS